MNIEIAKTDEGHNKFASPLKPILAIKEDSTAVTDTANAKRLMALYGNKIAWVGHWKQWVIWNGKYWERDESMHIITLAKQVVQYMYTLIPNVQNTGTEGKERAIFAKGVASCDNMSKLLNMVESAKNEANRSYERFDTHPFLFNCENGTLNLKTGILEDFNPAHYMTKISHVYYDPKAECPKWEDTIGKAFHNNKETISYFQKLGGYAMTGDTREQAFYILWGTGQNLKSTILNVLESVIGEYAIKASTDTFVVKRSNATSGDLVRLRNSRFVKAVETEMDAKLAENIIKILTGEDGITAREIYEKNQQFDIEFKLLLATNNKPIIKGKDLGIWRRVKLIPFVYIAQKDPSFASYHLKIIDEESSGVLNWLLRGCISWQMEGLKDCKEVAEATNIYKSENDTIGKFIKDNLKAQVHHMIGANEMYARIITYCDEMGEELPDIKHFKEEMINKGFIFKRKETGVFWMDLVFCNHYDDELKTEPPKTGQTKL